ncbi:MAG: hypothetical protein Q7T86_09530 [Hyphomicrobiaceae bacterium]|nr:hypothetical protein [Hyphomicrobiaceae bacterium]
MLRLGTYEGSPAGIAAYSLLALAAAYALPKGALPYILVVSAFGAAILNIVISEQRDGAPSYADLGFLFVTGLTASSFGSDSILTEFALAILRMGILGLAVWALAWVYQRLRGPVGLSATDILLVAILSAFLPLAVAIYTVAVAITLTVGVIVALQLFRKQNIGLQDRMPIASGFSVFYFCAWVAYSLKADAAF